MSNTIHLICNAHLDPVWLWRREEGIAEAISTFRTAADFCEEYDNFVFCHNESLLYEWIEQYDPELFERIRKLVKEKLWHIMGGWYLQPDCNMISGESLIRQIKLGKKYFQEKFEVYPETAINFDPFGHSRGMVQVMVKAGFSNYLFMRPSPTVCKLPAETFVWEGYDGSQITAKRLFRSYMTLRGTAQEKLEAFVDQHEKSQPGAVTWGIGNHGGGPSRVDLDDLSRYIAEHQELDIRHSSPDAYFTDVHNTGSGLPIFRNELNYFAVGCYTSMVRIKQQQRQLENELSLTEKMATAASVATGVDYPFQEFEQAEKDLSFIEFHDILPGSAIKPVEDDSLRIIGHGREILSQIRNRMFFAMLKERRKAEEGNTPVFVWNPHPYPVKTVIEAEMQLADQNWKDDCFYDVEVFHNSVKISSQIEQEESKMNLDWRKKVVFNAELPPGTIVRYECVPVEKKKKPEHITRGDFVFDNGSLHVEINRRTGLIDSCRVDDLELVRSGFGRILVMNDNADPWELKTTRFRKKIGQFSLMSQKEAADFAGISGNSLAPIMIIEDGPVRTVIEAQFKYRESRARVQYIFPADGQQFDVKMSIHNQQANCMYKLSMPFVDSDAGCIGQDMFGIKDIPSDGSERVFSQWFAAVSKSSDKALGIICNSGHGIDFRKGEMRYSMLRSPCYAAHPVMTRPLVTEDRVHDRIDIGVREFCFRVCGGKSENLISYMTRETILFSEPPLHQVFFPGGSEEREYSSLIELSNSPVVMTSCHQSEKSADMIIRLFNSSGENVETTLSISSPKLSQVLLFNGFEVKTFKINISSGNLEETNILV